MNLSISSLLFKQLASLLKAGIPLNRSLKILASRSKKGLKRSLEKVSSSLENGASFSDAMLLERLISGAVYDSFSSAEKNSYLEEALVRTAAMLDKKAEFTKKIKRALAYPLLVLALSCSSLAGMILFVLPSYSAVFADTGSSLPPLTRIALVLPSYGWVFFAAAASIGLLAFFCARDPDLMLRMPVGGRIAAAALLSDLSVSLSCQIKGGLPLIHALKSASKSTNSSSVSAMLDRTGERISSGSSMAQAFTGEKLASDTFIQLVAVGEESGSLPEMLWQAGERAAEDADAMLSALVSCIEPAATLTVGGVVAFVALSMIMPLFSMVNSLL